MVDIKSLKSDSIQNHGIIVHMSIKYYLFKFANKETTHLSPSPSNKFNFFGTVDCTSEKRSKSLKQNINNHSLHN